MKIVWITRSFLDYRIPVFRELDELVGGELHLLFSGDYVPRRVAEKARAVLGEQAIALHGEWRIGPEDREFLANRNISVRWRPGLGKRIHLLRPDVMVCDGFFKWTFPCLIERALRKTPLVVCYERTAHTERNAQWFRRAYRTLAIGCIDAMCCNGRLSSDYVKRLGMPSERITLGHMAADIEGLSKASKEVSSGEKAALREKLSLSGTTFLYVGRLIELKGVDMLVKAWDGFKSRVPGSVSLLILGDGPQKGDLEEFCRKRGLTGVRFAGPVDYDHIAVYYAVADIFVMPTLEDNWSLVVPEAMACGLPILCSKYNGCWPELVHEGKNGWVFDPSDAKGFTAALEAAIRHKANFSKMGEASIQIIEHHSPEAAAKSVLSACKIAVHRKMASHEGG